MVAVSRMLQSIIVSLSTLRWFPILSKFAHIHNVRLRMFETRGLRQPSQGQERWGTVQGYSKNDRRGALKILGLDAIPIPANQGPPPHRANSAQASAPSIRSPILEESTAHAHDMLL